MITSVKVCKRCACQYNIHVRIISLAQTSIHYLCGKTNYCRKLIFGKGCQVRGSEGNTAKPPNFTSPPDFLAIILWHINQPRVLSSPYIMCCAGIIEFKVEEAAVAEIKEQQGLRHATLLSLHSNEGAQAEGLRRNGRHKERLFLHRAAWRAHLQRRVPFPFPRSWFPFQCVSKTVRSCFECWW